MPRSVARLIGIVAVVVLTLVTQIGGVALILCWFFARTRLAARVPHSLRIVLAVMLFVASYFALTWSIVPPLASVGARVPLPCRAEADRPFAAGHQLYCVLNRHYVDARMLPVLTEMSRGVAKIHPGTITLFLDANFPFLNGFPLLPHLSHNDGRKLDIAFHYAAPDGTYLAGTMRSPVGYWAFETPPDNEPSPCAGNRSLSLRWDMSFLQGFFPNRPLEPQRTRATLNWLVTEGLRFGVEKVFIEPHLAKRLGVSSPVIGFQGCRAARHDDHIHFQISR